MVGGLLALALIAPCAEPARAGGFQPGDELTFTGTVSEGANRVGNRFRRAHELELRVLMLEAREGWFDAAVLVVLRRTDDVVAGAVADLTGGPRDRAAPPLVRLDLVRVHADGSVHALAPVGPPPLALGPNTPARAPPAPPLDTFAPFEFGMFPPRPPRAAPGEPFAVAPTDPTRPAETWQEQGTEFVAGERCARLVMNQRHPNWDAPRGGRSAWFRADAVWVSALDGTARKVHRVIKHRDGLDAEPAAWVEVAYALKDRTRAIGRTFDRARRDIETAFAAAAEAAPFLPDAARHGAKFFDARIQKLDAYLAGPGGGGPYREAVGAVRRQLEAARRGDPVGAGLVPATPAAPVTKKAPWPRPGEPAPDFRAGAFHLSAHRGKPVVLVFFKPGSETAGPALAVADALRAKHAPRAAVVPLAVWAEPRPRPGGAPVYDGALAEALYGVESVPRFALVDGRGVVRWAFAGVGGETGFDLNRELERLLAPSSATDTAGAPGPGTAPPGARPR